MFYSNYPEVEVAVVVNEYRCVMVTLLHLFYVIFNEKEINVLSGLRSHS